LAVVYWQTAQVWFAAPAQMLSQLLSQQNASASQTVSWQSGLVHPGLPLLTQQSAPHTPAQLLFAAVAQRLSQVVSQQNESLAQVCS
jgi:hypothetical protein